MATTTNYSWSTPDDTALVKDGAAAIRSLGTAIDTTVFNNAGAAIPKTIVDAKGDIIAGTAADTVARLAYTGTNGDLLTIDTSTATGLKWVTPAAPAPSGLTFISRTTFSASAAVTVDNLFSDTYENYLIRIQATGSAAANLQIQFRYGSTTHTTANYDYAWGGVDATANTFRFIRNYGQSQILLDVMNTSYRSLYDLNICRLNGTDRIQLTGNTWGQENIQGMAGGAFTAAQQAWSGMYLTPSTGTMTGQISVYGMAKS